MVVGENEFSVRLVLDQGDGLAHLPARLGFDPESLQLVSSRPGEWFSKGGEARVLAAEGSESGEIVIGASRPRSARRLRGEGAVVELRFRARPGFLGATELELLEGEAMSTGRVPMAVTLSPQALKVVVAPQERVRPERPAVP